MKRLNAILMLLALSAIAILALGGCSSDDGVTPHEDPVYTAEDNAYQAAAVAAAMAQVLQDMTTKADVDLRNIETDYVYGSYWDDGEADRVWTEGGNVLHVDFTGLPHDTYEDGLVIFDITATDDLANSTGTCSCEFPTLTITYNIVNVMLDPGNYPVGGQIVVGAGSETATIEFFDGHTATVTVGDDVWDVNMDTIELT